MKKILFIVAIALLLAGCSNATANSFPDARDKAGFPVVEPTYVPDGMEQTKLRVEYGSLFVAYESEEKHLEIYQEHASDRWMIQHVQKYILTGEFDEAFGQVNEIFETEEYVGFIDTEAVRLHETYQYTFLPKDTELWKDYYYQLSTNVSKKELRKVIENLNVVDNEIK